MALLNQIVSLFSRLLFQTKCSSCSMPITIEDSLCSDCWNNITFITQPMCNRCGQPLSSTGQYFQKCISCYYEDNVCSNIRSILIYNETSSSIIKKFKYDDQIDLSKMFSQLMYNLGRDFIENADIVVPVALHINKLRKRKYNQSALLSSLIAKASKKLHIPNLLIRIKDIPQQSKLNKLERRENIKGAFKINERIVQRIVNKTILLIDDVITTGATSNECAKILLQNDAKNVLLLTLARTP